MLGALLPSSVSVEETFTCRYDFAALHDAERSEVECATPRRRQEFTAVRACARIALAAIGTPAQPILRTHDGIPIWPDGVTGSMTHCSGYRAAAVVLTRKICAIGIDAEPAVRLPPGTLELIAHPAERPRLEEMSELYQMHPWDVVLFSAKEAVYKALTFYGRPPPSLRVMIASIQVNNEDTTRGTFCVDPFDIRGADHIAQVRGRWGISQHIVITAAAIADPSNA